MKNKKVISLVLAVVLFIGLVSCNSKEPAMHIQMELDQNYDESDIFVDERLIYASEDISSLKLNVNFQMKGESGKLEIFKYETEEILRRDSWDGGDVDERKFTVVLNNLEKEKQYIVRFTGVGITYAKIDVSSNNRLIKELERPIKPDEK